MLAITTFVTLSLFIAATAAIGPTSDLEIINKVISPDGFNRSYVPTFFSGNFTLIVCSQVRSSPAVHIQERSSQAAKYDLSTFQAS